MPAVLTRGLLEKGDSSRAPRTPHTPVGALCVRAAVRGRGSSPCFGEIVLHSSSRERGPRRRNDDWRSRCGFRRGQSMSLGVMPGELQVFGLLGCNQRWVSPAVPAAAPSRV